MAERIKLKNNKYWDSTGVVTNASGETLDTTLSSHAGRLTSLEATAATLDTAATYGVANNLTTATAGSDVLDAVQGKVLGDRLTTAEGNITSLDGRIGDVEEEVSSIGTSATGEMASTTATTTGTYKAVASVAHGVGTYLVTTSAAFGQSTTGIRVAIVTNASTSNTPVSDMATATAVPLNGYWTRLSHAFVIRASSAGTWHLKVFQNSGEDLNCTTAVIQATLLAN